MGYIGQAPVNEFSGAPTKDVFTGDASTTTFDLATAVAAGAENAIEVYIDNVRQEPGSGKAFTVGVDGSGDMKRITFTAAPANSAVIYVLNPLTNVQAIAPTITDLNGVELILDADGDSSITADTDDRFDFKVSGTDQIQLADGVLKPVTDSDVDLGTSSLYFKDAYIDTVTTTGNVTVGGDLTITGTTSFADTNITNVGSIALDTITNDGTDITLDSGGDIILDADGTQIFLKDAGTTFGSLTQTGGELVIKSSSSDTTALTFSGANATFAGTLGVGAITGTSTIQGTTITATTGFTIGSAAIVEAELETIDGVTAGTVAASKAVVVDGNKDIGTFRNVTIDGTLSDGNYTFDTSGNVSGLGTVGSGAITSSGVITGTTIEATGDTSASDNAAIGYTAGEGLILTGQGSTSDVTIKNDADGTVFTVPTGTDDILFPDSAKGMWGTGSDLTLYHDGSNSYITNAVGALKIATETSGIALTIGHTTSETTVADNLTVTGTTTLTGTQTFTAASTFSAGATLTEDTLTDQATVTWDASTSPVAKVTLGANRTLASASSGGTGQFISLLVIQDGTGSRTLTWNAAYEFKDDTAPTLTTTADKGDLFVFRYNGSKWLEVGRNQALTLS